MEELDNPIILEQVGEQIIDYHKINRCESPWEEPVELSIITVGDSVKYMTPGLPLVYDTVELRDDIDSLYFKFSLYLYPCESYFEANINTSSDSIFFNCHEHQCGNGQKPSQDYYYQMKGVKKD